MRGLRKICGCRYHRGGGRWQQLAVYLYRTTGAGLAIALMEVLARVAEEPLSRVPFVTSIVLVMALPDSPQARAYNVVAGHMLCCVAGLAAFWSFGSGDTACAVALGLALFLMLMAQALHPPAGINAFLIAAYGLPLSWAISPVLVGAIFLVGYKRVWWQLEQWMRATDAFAKLPESPDWIAAPMDANPLIKWRPHWPGVSRDTDGKPKPTRDS
jgi:CBS-domain-containing membrane protein